MYYIAFLIDNELSLKIISKFLSIEQQNMFLSIGTKNEKIFSIKEIPKPSNGYIYLNSWYIHGNIRNDKCILKKPVIELYKEKTFSQINELLKWFSDTYSWVIFP